jgi:hypothetical protein
MEKKSVGLLELEMAVLEFFLEKAPLSPLGVNNFLVFFPRVLNSINPLPISIGQCVINCKLFSFTSKEVYNVRWQTHVACDLQGLPSSHY